jgi:hypothetical protein
MKTYCFSIFGESLILRTNSSDFAENLFVFMGAPFIEETRDSDDSMDRVIEVTVNRSKGRAEDAFPYYLLKFFTKIAVVLSSRFVFFHACSIAFDDFVVALCGPSGSGKTTLSMAAHHIGYNVSGEDLTVVEWKNGIVWPLTLPFRPRPWTIELLENWHAEKNTPKKINIPYRPRPFKQNLPLRCFFYAGGTRTVTQGIFESVLGAGRIGAQVLARKIPRALAGCTITKSPPVRIDPFISEKKMADVFELWIKSGTPKLPPEIFGKES